jgi:nitroreductase
MELIDALRNRRSVRSYQARPVEREKLEELAEALRISPSASNQQPWRLVLVDDPELKGEVAGATFGKAIGFNRFAMGAPVMAVIVIEPPRALNRVGAALKGREYPLIDIGIAAAQLALRAADLGLGTCLLGWFDERKVKKLLGIPRARRIGLLATVGYPVEGVAQGNSRRKPLDEARSYNRY